MFIYCQAIYYLPESHIHNDVTRSRFSQLMGCLSIFDKICDCSIRVYWLFSTFINTKGILKILGKQEIRVRQPHVHPGPLLTTPLHVHMEIFKTSLNNL